MARGPLNVQERLIAAVDAGVRSMFPVRSHEYQPGTSKYREYVDALDTLLRALVDSKSVHLLQVSFEGREQGQSRE